MSYRIEKNLVTSEPEIIIDGFENGIAPSPHKGIANLKGVNTATEQGEALSSFIRVQESQVCGNGTLTQANMTTDVEIFLTTTGLQNWTVPADWSNANTIEVIGAGGGPGDSGGTNHRAGGGGGGYSKVTNLYGLTPGASVPYSVGAAGAQDFNGDDTWFGASTLAASYVGAKGGKSATITGTVGTGGQASAGIGDVKYSGGNGGGDAGAGGFGGSGGGGAAGPNGAGVDGAQSTGAGGFGVGGNGGAGDNSVGGAGGTAPSGNGSNGLEWTTKGSGGGGAGGNETGSTTGGNAGLYGAGAGSKGLLGTQGTSAQGIIRIVYRPAEQALTVSGIVLKVGSWIHITNAGTTGLSGDYYYVETGRLSRTFSQDNTTYVGGINDGSATFSVYCMGKPIQSATEVYTDSANTTQYRYYILDDLAQLWVHDTHTLSMVTTPAWFLPFLAPTLSGRVPSGLAVFNGWVTFTLDDLVYWISTSVLGGTTFYQTSNIQLSSRKIHATLVGHQGKLYWTDGNFIASIFPNSSLQSGGANIQSYASYTAATTTCSIATLIGGTYPTLATSSLRVPVIFYTAGTLPTALTPDLTLSGAIKTSILYWIKWLQTGVTFEVYAAATGGGAIDMQTGAVGTQYFNTFSPLSNTSTAPNYTFSAQRLNLPFFETAQCMAELGNAVVIGGTSNTLYPWDQVSSTPGTVIALPENNVTQLVTVNSVLYVFAGQKGNVYITNGSSASYALSVPDYCAGIAGTPSTYIEPYFTWGAAAFLRGRVFFSILDQTSAKAGNCGGIWSFVPTQSGGTPTDVGTSLRLENQNSYATYNGVATVIIPNQNQLAIAPQYWSGWYSSISTPLYGIDNTGTIPTTTSILETDLIPTGTALAKMTFKQIEYKLGAPLVAGDSLSFSYRQNGTDSFTSCGTVVVESTTALSGYVPVNFEKGQWLQIQMTYTPLASASSSFIRLKQIIIR